MSKFFTSIQALTRHVGIFLQPYFLLFLRLYWGFAFFQAGYAKCINHEQTMQFFQSLDIPYAAFNAYFVAFVEAVAGIALILGYLSRISCLPLIVILLTALFTAHKEAVSAIFQNFHEFMGLSPIPFLVATMAILCFGPGRLSLDALQKRE